MRPNILIFNPDHYRGEAMAHAGSPAVKTPNLDAIAEQDGVSFSNAYCQNGVCTPSRCCFMTGWYTHVRGHRTMYHMLRKDEPDLLSRLKNEGYFVWWGGKNDLTPAQDGYDKYCDVYYQPPRERERREDQFPRDPEDFSFMGGKLERKPGNEFIYDVDWQMVLGAEEQIGDMPADKPFCIYLPLQYPHPPFAVEDPYYSMIDRDKVPPRIPTPENWDERSSMLKGIYERTGLQDWTEEQWNEMRAIYYGMCTRIDDQFGRIVQALKDAGQYDNTAIFFFSDHGMYTGDYGIIDINQNTFEDCLTKVPFVFKPPKGTPIQNGINNTLIELTDFVPTVEELTGIPATHTHFGRSLLAPAADSTLQHRDAVFCEGGRLHGESHCMELDSPGTKDPTDLYWPRLSYQAAEGPEHGRGTMLRTKEYKYVRRLYEGDELYDLAKDPQELVNVIDDPAYAETLITLKERMLTFYQETSDIVPFDTDKRW